MVRIMRLGSTEVKSEWYVTRDMCCVENDLQSLKVRQVAGSLFPESFHNIIIPVITLPKLPSRICAPW